MLVQLKMSPEEKMTFTSIRSTKRIVEAVMKGEDSYGKPLDCVGLPIQAQVGKHDFVKLTPQEAKDKGLLTEDGEIPRAHLSQKFVFQNDWTKTKYDVCVPMYTETEAALLASLRQIRDLLVRACEPGPAEFISLNKDIGEALATAHSILSDHEVPK